MKDKELQLRIKKYGITAARHWYVFPVCLPYPEGISQKFGQYEDARKYALSLAYAKNIETVD